MPEQAEWEDESLTRRVFIMASLTTASIVAAGGTVYPLYRYLFPSDSKGGGKGTSVTIPEAEVVVGGARFFKFKGKPAILIRKSEKEVIAMSAVCTHLGCVVKYSESDQIIKCPCHGAKFDLKGKVIAGPAPKPLQLFLVSRDGGKFVIEEA